MPPPTDQTLADFGTNLRLACSYIASIAEVCRRLELNRSQFNRYLAGESRPSAHTLRRLGDFFGFEPHEWWLPHAHFARLLGVRPQPRREAPDSEPAGDRNGHLHTLAALAQGCGPALERYLGYWFEYYHSMAYPGRVLKSLLWLRSSAQGVSYTRMERLAPPGRTAGVERCRYVGTAYALNDRIFLLDAERLTANELTQTIVFPSYKSRVTRLAGLMLGVSAADRREPTCARVVLETLGLHIDLRKALRQCGLIRHGEPGVDDDILSRIDNRETGSEWHFVGRPYS
jgi:transcriptional regulator with XRE-family HTH domain